MSAVENQLLIGGQAVQRLRKAFPRQKSLEQKAEAIINEWLEDRAAVRAANAAEKISDKLPRVKAHDLYRECGL
jgi:hypothetical protein